MGLFITLPDSLSVFSCFNIWLNTILSVIMCLFETFNLCFVSLGGPVSPASFTSAMCTRLPGVPLIDQKMDKQIWCLRDSHQLPGVPIHKHTNACVCLLEHTLHTFSLFFLHSSVSVIPPSSLTGCCNIVLPFWHLPVRLHSSRVVA